MPTFPNAWQIDYNLTSDDQSYWDTHLASIILPAWETEPEHPPKAQPLPPNPFTLIHLHRTAAHLPAETDTLEFGAGWSTFLLAHLAAARRGRHWTVEPPGPWATIAADRCRRTGLERRLTLHFARPSTATWDKQPCHLYQTLPDIVPSLIFIDGPAPEDVTGTYHNLTWNKSNRPTITADPLLYEPTLPWDARLVIDFRLHTTLFLALNLRRPWKLETESVLARDGQTGRSVSVFTQAIRPDQP